MDAGVDPNSIEYHHVVPKAEEFAGWFERAGIDVKKYLLPLAAGAHMQQLPKALKEDIFNFAKQLLKEFGLDSTGVGLPDLIITLDPCLFPDMRRVLNSCSGGGSL
jgi:hypothetical protein